MEVDSGAHSDEDSGVVPDPLLQAQAEAEGGRRVLFELFGRLGRAVVFGLENGERGDLQDLGRKQL